MNSSEEKFHNTKRRVQRFSQRLQKQFIGQEFTIGEKLLVETTTFGDETTIKSITKIDENAGYTKIDEKDISLPKQIPFFLKEISLSTGQKIIVNDIILALGGGKRDEEIAESFKVPISEILGIRRNFKLLRQYHSTRERTADIISLIKPVFKTLTKDEKLKWAKRLKLSVSQLYRIISKNYDQVTASIPLKPRTTKNREHFESRFYTREAEIKYCSIGDLKSGKRTKSIKGVSKEDLKLSEKYTSVFTNSSIIVEPAPSIAISIVEFKDLWRHFKTSDTPDEDMAKKCGFNIGRIREIRAFHNFEANHPLKGKELIEDLLRSIESHNLFKLFDRKQKEYSGQSAPEITSIDKICDSYGISRATLYRKLNNMSNIKNEYFPEPPKRCFTIIKINQRWYDVDSFIHGRKSSMRYISFFI